MSRPISILEIGGELVERVHEMIEREWAGESLALTSDRARLTASQREVIELSMWLEVHAHHAKHGLIGLCARCGRTLHGTREINCKAWFDIEHARLTAGVSHRNCGAVQ